MKISKEKQQHLAVVGGVTLAILAALYWFGISTPKARMAKSDKDVEAAKGEIEKYQRYVKTKDFVVADLVRESNELAEIEAEMAPSGDKYSWFLNVLHNFSLPYSSQVNIPLKGKDVAGEAGMFEGFPYRVATFTIKGDAYYHQFGRFVADLENKYPYFRLQRLAMTPAPAESTETPERVSFEMDIVTLVSTNSP